MVNQIIINLHNITLTPKPKECHFDIPAFSNSLDALISCDNRSIAFPDFTDEEIKDFIHFLPLLVDAPSNLRGILHIEGSLRHLLSVFLNDATDDTAVRAQCLALLDNWFHHLRNSVPSDVVILNKRPLIKDSPIISFHFVAFNKSLLNDKTYPFYEAYSHTIHTAIRVFKRKNPGQGQYESAVRAARYLFLFMSSHILSLPSHPRKMPPEYQEIFLKNLKERVKSDGVVALTDFYKRLFKQLTGHARVKRRKKSPGSSKKHKKKPLAGPDELKYEIGNVTMEPEDENDIEFLSNDFLLSNPEELVVAKKPHLSRSSLDAINNLNHHFWWDRDCLKLDELHAIYAACATQWSKSDQFDRIIIFILLLLHFRYDSVSLLKLSLNKSCTPRLQKIDQQLYLIIAPPIKRSYESFAGCRTATSTIYLPVPAKLSRLIESKLETSIDFFEYTGIDGLKKHLELHQIVQFLNKLINRDNFFITLSCIQSSHPILG